MFVKGSAFQHRAVVAAGAAALGALLLTNVYAFAGGMATPWLLGVVVLTDMLVVGVGIVVAAREVMIADQRMDASQARLDAIVDSAMDPIITVDEAQGIVLFNRAAEQVFRCARAEALGAPLERFIPQRFRAAHRGHVGQFGRTGITSRRMSESTTLWALRADGEEFPIEASISQAGAPGSRYYTVILRDITLRKRSEDTMLRQQRELRELSARVVEAREEEKTRIARELHDELGQLLTALKMDLAWLRERLPAGGGELAAKAQGMGQLLDQTVASTRRISADLRPLMLDDLGLAAALDWLTQNFSKHTGIATDLVIDDAVAQVREPIASALYRITQESLTNIAKYAKATGAEIRLEHDEDWVELTVRDNGRGIKAADQHKHGTFGLRGIRERVSLLGGSVTIVGEPGRGSEVRARVPLAAAGAEENGA